MEINIDIQVKFTGDDGNVVHSNIYVKSSQEMISVFGEVPHELLSVAGQLKMLTEQLRAKYAPGPQPLALAQPCGPPQAVPPDSPQGSFGPPPVQGVDISLN